MEAPQKKNADQFKITGDWSVQSRNLKTKFPQLTESDLKYETGKDEDLLKRVETRLHKNRQEVIKMFANNQTTKS